MIHTLTVAALVTFGALATAFSFLLEWAWRMRQQIALAPELAWSAASSREEDEGLTLNEWVAYDQRMRARVRSLLVQRPDLFASELGAPSLMPKPREDLIDDVWFIADVNLESAKREEATPKGGLMLIPSPIWEPGPGGLAYRTLSYLPEPFGAYVSGPGTQDRIRDEMPLQELVADLYLRSWREPLEGLVDTWEVRQLFLRLPDKSSVPRNPELTLAVGMPPRVPVGIERPDQEPHFQYLSILVADVIRRLAAGMTVQELRASYGLSRNAALRRSAAAKLQRLRREESRWYDEAARVMEEYASAS